MMVFFENLYMYQALYLYSIPAIYKYLIIIRKNCFLSFGRKPDEILLSN